jgi:hypothetical protein
MQLVTTMKSSVPNNHDIGKSVAIQKRAKSHCDLGFLVWSYNGSGVGRVGILNDTSVLERPKISTIERDELEAHSVIL